MTAVEAPHPVTDQEPVEPIPFNLLSLQWQQIKDEALPAIEQLFEEGSFCLGPHVESFERSAKAYLDARHAIGVNSGTSALHLALIAAGIGRGDKVLVPSITFVATAWAVLYVGAIPVLCDVEADGATIDVSDAERRIDSAVKAVIPVHIYGQPANMAAVAELAARHRLSIVEDAAQAFGARYGKKHVGTIGEFGCYSFYPGKNLGAAGEGGLVVTANDEAAQRLRALRNHAQQERYSHSELGFNYRMEGIQALVLNHKLPLLDIWTKWRRALARAYDERLQGVPIELPAIVNGDHVFHLYVVRTKERDRLRYHLQMSGIETGLHYPIPLHRQPCLAQFADRVDSYPISDRHASQCLSLPLFAGMTVVQVERVCFEIRKFFGSACC